MKNHRVGHSLRVDDIERSELRPCALSHHLAVTLWGLFCERVRRSRDRVAYRDYDPNESEWVAPF